MNNNFKIFQDKLNINLLAEPEISFVNVGLKDQNQKNQGEFLVFSYSFLATQEDVELLEQDEYQPLNMDIEMNNFAKVFATSFLMNMGITPQFYNFVTNRKPLITLEDYFSMYNDDEYVKNEDEEESYVRVAMCVCYPSNLPIPEQMALDMGIKFMEDYDMEEINIEKIQKFYNDNVDSINSVSKSKIHYFYLNHLGDLLELPFHSVGKVYKNYRINKPPYIYETDSILFDFLDEYDGTMASLSEMEVVVKDVNKIIKAIK